MHKRASEDRLNKSSKKKDEECTHVYGVLHQINNADE